MKTAVILSTFLLLPVIGRSSTIVVPDDHPTVQLGIDAAMHGDTVLVKPGTYLENIWFKGKAITVLSSNGPEVTILDGGALDSVVKIDTTGMSSAVLDGFTIQNGSNCIEGGGVFCKSSYPIIRNNRIIHNGTVDYGGGIYLEGGFPVVQNNFVAGNKGHFGSGICGIATTGTIIENVVVDNGCSG